MTSSAVAPADTTMMRIVHNALRRDLRRARTALSATPPPATDQRRAIAGHVSWMMEFLHAHHRSEDDGLYPLVRERDPRAAEILDAMAAQHDAIAPEIGAVEAAAATLAEADSDDAAAHLAAALAGLEQVLLPHLRQEEDEAMPVVSAAITNAEWEAIEDEYNLAGKSMVTLAHEGHWLIDDTTDHDRAVVVGLVPPIPRFVLVHGFARRYRRHKERCWGPTRPKRRVQLRGRVEVTTDASVDAVWNVVNDVTRIGEWSHECVSASWLGDARSAVPGARFRGRNRAGVFRWGRICEVVASDPYELVWRTVPTTFTPDSCEWRITLDGTGSGTVITQCFEAVHAPKALTVLYGLVIPAHRDRTAALVADLERLGSVARGGA